MNLTDTLTTEITAGTAVAHKRMPLTMQGRVRLIRGHRALIVWVRRRMASYAYLTSLEPISDEVLRAFFEQQEALYDAIREDEVYAGLAPPAVTSDENRRFLLGETL